MTLSLDDLNYALRNIEHLDPGQKARVLDLLDERERLRKITEAREHFLPFVKLMWPSFIAGAHHTIMAEAFDKVAQGTLKRLIINLGPRHTKSELASWLLPAWFLGRNPTKKIIQASNTEALAAGFGRRVRNLIGGEYDEEDEHGHPALNYSDVFPGVVLAKDSQAAAGWHTSRRGEYFAIGTSGRVTGKGADLLIIDDPHSEQEAKQAESSPDIFDGVFDWYTSGPRQRLQPGGAVVIVMTRWSKRDLTGQVIKRMQMRGEDKSGDNWTVIELPAILDRGEKTERSMWPGYWKLPELKATLEEIGEAKFSAQYQQKPTSEQGAILKRELWKKWGHDTNTDLAVGKSSCPSAQHAGAWAKGDPPACDFIIHSWDTAQKKTERADYTAMTSWGVFKTEALELGDPLDPNDESAHPLRPRRLKTVNNLILLSAYKERLSFPELKARIKQFYDEDSPDTLLIEDKGSGISLIQEFRSMGIPVENFSYGRGSKKLPNDKIARANLVTDIFASGYVWAPETRFAEAVIEECGEFPNSEHDDYVDTVVQALLRFRTGGFIRTANDEEDVDNVRRFRRKRYY
jgi:predicted phage terminase large subunit-like protein